MKCFNNFKDAKISIIFSLFKGYFYEISFFKRPNFCRFISSVLKIIGLHFYFFRSDLRKLVCFAFYIYTLTQNLFLYSVYLARYIQEVYKNKVNEKKEDFLKWPWHWLFFCFASKICIKNLLISLILKPSLKVALVIFTPDCRP